MTRYTLSDIRAENEAAGQFFFSRDTMRFFGDTMRSFAVRHIDGKVFVQRIRAMHDTGGQNMGGIGDMREFDPATGHIGLVIKRSVA